MRGKTKGFSLIELVVALAILAAATTIALRATNNVQSQARYQNSTSTLNNIQDAILGPANQRSPDGSALVTGFVADVGRLPQIPTSGDPLTELLSANGIHAFSFTSPTFDPGIQIGVGWQGPYLRTGAGPSTLHDGWGNVFGCFKNDGTVSAAGDPIAQIVSLGSVNTLDTNHGGTGDTNGYDANVSIPNSSTLSGGGFNFSSTFSGQIRMLDSSGNQILPNQTKGGSTNYISIWVCYFGPKDDGTVAYTAVEVADGATSTWATAVANNFQFNVTGTIGPRALRAYVLPTGTTIGTFTSAVTTASASSPSFSLPLNVTGRSGGQTTPLLILPYYAP